MCQNGDIFYLSGDSLEPVESRYSLACYENQASFYIGPVDYCKKLGLVYGMNIDGTPIIFAEVCYDIENMEVDFIHFVMGERPIILGKQVPSFLMVAILSPILSSSTIRCGEVK